MIRILAVICMLLFSGEMYKPQPVYSYGWNTALISRPDRVKIRTLKKCGWEVDKVHLSANADSIIVIFKQRAQ